MELWIYFIGLEGDYKSYCWIIIDLKIVIIHEIIITNFEMIIINFEVIFLN